MAAVARSLNGALLLVLAVSVTAPGLADDVDQDGMDDALEATLLERYRPFYLFAAGEQYRPIAVNNFIQASELVKGPSDDYSLIYSRLQLLDAPGLILTANAAGPAYCSGPNACSSDLTKNKRSTAYHLKPLKHVPGNATEWPGRVGTPEIFLLSERNVGLYGHVVPINLATPINIPCSKRWSNLERPRDGTEFYKVEYWQFFGFNAADNQPLGIGEHEGDWTSVQLLVQPARFAPDPTLCVPGGPCGGRRMVSPERVVRVSHFMHGQEISFDFDSPHESHGPTLLQGGETLEFRGATGGHAIDINDRHFGNPCGAEMSVLRNNTLRMFREVAGTGSFTHPLVYIEKGGHEFWPTESGTLNYIIGGITYRTEVHRGDGQAFLTATPPNMGEVEAPMPNRRGSQFVLLYNGVWGKENRYNDPPHGPPLHGNWTWPAHSSVGWLIGDVSY